MKSWCNVESITYKDTALGKCLRVPTDVLLPDFGLGHRRQTAKPGTAEQKRCLLRTPHHRLRRPP